MTMASTTIVQSFFHLVHTYEPTPLFLSVNIFSMSDLFFLGHEIIESLLCSITITVPIIIIL